MKHDYHITMDSFGTDCPKNWEEIADYLNNVIDETLDRMGPDAFDMGGNLTADARDALDAIWENWCNGILEGAPEAVMEE